MSSFNEHQPLKTAGFHWPQGSSARVDNSSHEIADKTTRLTSPQCILECFEEEEIECSDHQWAHMSRSAASEAISYTMVWPDYCLSSLTGTKVQTLNKR
ncbi:hypothetical protein TNCV_1805161 [Trichonephila clavipes]|nr:hypothetical protein TNCV_1805161 [Trichonephila clavipes]